MKRHSLVWLLASLLAAALSVSLAEEPAAKKAPAKDAPKPTAKKAEATKADAPKTAAPKAVKFETPEACYQAMFEARKSKDPAAGLPCFSETMTNYLVGNTAFQLERISHVSDGGEPVKDCVKLLKKHKLYGKDLMGFLQVADSPGGGGAPLGFMQIGDSVAEKAAFMRDAVAAMKKVQEHFEKGKAKPEEKPAKADEETKPPALKKLTIDGDSARGEILTGADEEPQPIFFKKQAGSWVIKLSENEPDFRKGRIKFSDIPEVKEDGDSK